MSKRQNKIEITVFRWETSDENNDQNLKSSSFHHDWTVPWWQHFPVRCLETTNNRQKYILISAFEFEKGILLTFLKLCIQCRGVVGLTSQWIVRQPVLSVSNNIVRSQETTGDSQTSACELYFSEYFSIIRPDWI